MEGEDGDRNRSVTAIALENVRRQTFSLTRAIYSKLNRDERVESIRRVAAAVGWNLSQAGGFLATWYKLLAEEMWLLFPSRSAG